MSTMVSLKLAQCGAKPIAVDTHAIATVDDAGYGWQLRRLHLEITAQKHEPAADRLLHEAVEARRDCPILSVLNLDVACIAKLVSPDVPIEA